jgi:hypothetical protein
MNDVCKKRVVSLLGVEDERSGCFVVGKED